MLSSSTKNKNKVAPTMSITRSFPHRQEKICGLNSSTELKQLDDLFNKFLKESQEFADGIADTREDKDEGTRTTRDESDTSSLCTERRLRRIKRKLFLKAVNSPQESRVHAKMNLPKNRNGKE
jgi:hypothetical protein